MLVISRRNGEEVLLSYPDGSKMWITILEIGRNRVRMSFQGPRSIVVSRSELLDQEEVVDAKPE